MRCNYTEAQTSQHLEAKVRFGRGSRGRDLASATDSPPACFPAIDALRTNSISRRGSAVVARSNRCESLRGVPKPRIRQSGDEVALPSNGSTLVGQPTAVAPARQPEHSSNLTTPPSTRIPDTIVFVLCRRAMRLMNSLALLLGKMQPKRTCQARSPER